jgi:hypothetical protein
MLAGDPHHDRVPIDDPFDDRLLEARRLQIEGCGSLQGEIDTVP